MDTIVKDTIAPPDRATRGGDKPPRRTAEFLLPRGVAPGGSFLSRYALVGILLLLVAACLVLIPEFRSWRLVGSMVNTQSIILLLALVATIVLRTGDFDLSIPQVMIGSALIVAVLSREGVPPLAAVGVAVALGAVVGLINGYLVVVIGVDSFVTTLGTSTALGGFAYLISGSRIVPGVPDVFIDAARSTVAGLPLITWYAWILVLVLWFVYQKTPIGRYLLFIGGNRNASRLAGLRVTPIRLVAYLVSGVLAAVIGVVYAGYLGAVDPSVGGQYMLQPLAAVFLGATAITVGRFNPLGTMVALYLLTVGITGLQLMGAQTWVTNMFYGSALVIAVTAAKIAERRARRSRT
jgi:ribose transport system permease protein